MAYNRLRGRIIERYGTMSNYAEASGQTVSNLSKLLRSKNGLKTETIKKMV